MFPVHRLGVYLDHLVNRCCPGLPIFAQSPPIDVCPKQAPKFNFSLPKIEAPPVELPKVEAPKIELPKVDAPKIELPKVEAPKFDAPKFDLPKFEAPKVEAPKVSKRDSIPHFCFI
jgi:hypothetical protein